MTSSWPGQRLRETCHVCNAKCVHFTWRGTHCNGNPFEDAEYSCGARMTYIPNYAGLPTAYETVTRCPKDPVRVEEDRRKKEMTDGIVRAIGASYRMTPYELVRNQLPYELRTMVEKNMDVFLAAQKAARPKEGV
jgi:hypothetical protein